MKKLLTIHEDCSTWADCVDAMHEANLEWAFVRPFKNVVVVVDDCLHKVISYPLLVDISYTGWPLVDHAEAYRRPIIDVINVIIRICI